jgi:hypothetical protein
MAPANSPRLYRRHRSSAVSKDSNQSGRIRSIMALFHVLAKRSGMGIDETECSKVAQDFRHLGNCRQDRPVFEQGGYE